MSTENNNLQNRDQDQQNENRHTGQDDIKHAGSESNAAPDHGHADMTSRPSEGVVGSTHSSGISTKSSVTGSDFDGQVSSS